MLEFKVKDTGIGIPKDKQSKLFNSFTQVDSSTTRKYGGTGLGLAISYKLAKLMGGDIVLESEAGVGSEFTFKISSKMAPSSPQRVIYPSPQLTGKKVLVVDDNITNIRILKYQLEQWGLEGEYCLSAQEGLQQLEKHKFDFVISDMQMPEMDGVGFAETIRLNYNSENIPILLLSSIGDLNGKKNRKELFAAIMTKPVKQQVLFNTILGVLQLSPKELVKKPSINPLFYNVAEKYPLNILIAEDNQINQKLALKVFDKLGYKPDLAQNGREVLDFLNNRAYDVIFMDVQMPELDGLETTKRIRKGANLLKMPFIIAMTANALQGDREICLKAGMDDYISKPFRVDEVIKALEKVAVKESSNPFLN